MAVGRNGRRVSGFVRDFQEFALKGNVMDLAIGVVIGAAFGKIVTSMTEDIIMPAISLPFGNIQKASWRQITIPPSAEGGIKIGSFLGTVIDFLIIALVLYLVIRAIARFKRKEEMAPPAPTEKECPYCLEKVPIAATRCRACTSELAPTVERL
jgi:large conductance mechanosensitive channel